MVGPPSAQRELLLSVLKHPIVGHAVNVPPFMALLPAVPAFELPSAAGQVKQTEP